MTRTRMRTHNCGELNEKDSGSKVTLCGWVHSRRDHGGMIFIDLRDRYGITQIVVDSSDKISYEASQKLRREFVIQASGKVRKRKKGMENPKLSTGMVEVEVKELNVINKSEVPPIEVSGKEAGEEVRLKYRYIDLRRPDAQKRMKIRHDITQAAREYLNKNSFMEIETPILVRATPEGARDYLVPSRVNPGKFYALPQSPQLYKQILMIAGFDRYYQIARCMRDEDLRQDRQPEHTQIDLEMSFVESEDIMETVEGLYKYIVEKITGKKIKEKFPVFTYAECIEKYGCDKPDLRFALELTDVTDIAKNSDFSVFRDAVENNGIVKCINPEKKFTRKEIDELTEICIKNGAAGMAWANIEQRLEGGAAKHLESVEKEILKKTCAKKGILLFVAGQSKTVNAALSQLRNELGKKLGLIKNELKFCWVKDFPLFEWENGWTPAHHMFTMPKKEYIKYLEKEPGKVLGDLFDIVLNGTEIGSGSIRISDPELQKKVMNVIGIDEERARQRFGFLLDAYKYGGPVHGGMGLGLDRFTALIQGINDIREVIAFPKNKSAECPMDGSPSVVDSDQLEELHIKLEKEEK